MVPRSSKDKILYPEAEECIKTLCKNYHIGIIANQNFRSKKRLEKLVLLKYIDLVIASAEVGIAKPDLRIYNWFE